MNTIGTIVGWVIFNAIRKVFRKFFTKIAINISSNDTLAIKLESYVYVVIAIICLFEISGGTKNNVNICEY
ncbi:hypothetical protein CBOS2020_21840 [Clostridium botulinum]|nr:hypothetical protein CBOS2020_21840 [Clostridium botulinum]